MSSYSLKSMNDNNDLPPLDNLDAPAPAAAPTVPVEDKHGERKVPASKTVESKKENSSDNKADAKQTVVIVSNEMLAAISDKMRAAIIKRSKAPDEKSERYKNYVATMAARAQKDGYTWEQSLQSLEYRTEYRTTNFNDLTLEQALELSEWIVHNKDFDPDAPDSDENHCCCLVTDKMRATISDKMHTAIIKRSKARDAKSVQYTNYIAMLLEAARESGQELVEYLTTLEDRAGASQVDLEIILQSVEEIFDDYDTSDRMRAAIMKRSKALDEKSEQYRRYEEKLMDIAHNKRQKLGHYLKMLEDNADASGVDLEIILQSIEDTKTITCQVCKEDKELADLEKLRCGHQIICTECLNRQFHVAMGDKNMSTLVCPDQKCKTPFFPEAAHGSQETKEAKLPNHALTDEDIKLLEATTKSCPNLRCRELIEKNDGCSHMTCKTCKHEFCWNCLGRWTLPHDCPLQARPIQAPAGAERNGRALMNAMRQAQQRQRDLMVIDEEIRERAFRERQEMREREFLEREQELTIRYERGTFLQRIGLLFNFAAIRGTRLLNRHPKKFLGAYVVVFMATVMRR